MKVVYWNGLTEEAAALFGRYGSGEGTLSTTYKRRVRERLRAKHPG